MAEIHVMHSNAGDPFSRLLVEQAMGRLTEANPGAVTVRHSHLAHVLSPPCPLRR